jgi:hypothetical protein
MYQSFVFLENLGIDGYQFSFLEHKNKGSSRKRGGEICLSIDIFESV